MQYRKRKTREVAMQILFAWDSQGAADTAAAQQIASLATEEEETRSAAVEMAHAAWEQVATLDAWIERLAPKWPPRRQPGVDRSVLRLAAWELTSGTAPAGVAIDEAISLAKQFSTQQSAAFVNGVLDSMRKEHQTLISAANNASPQAAPAVPEPPATSETTMPTQSATEEPR
jgi:N utilization substance protein B